jgi:hypothetical protein
MLRWRAVQILSAYVLIASSQACACDASFSAESIKSIERKLLAAKVERIDILRISDEIRTLVRISPEDFDRYPHTRHTLHLVEQDAASLAAAVKSLKPTQLLEPPDLRWKVTFLDVSGSKLHSILLDKAYWYGRGRKGYIDEEMCRFSPSLVEWLQKRIPEL